MAKSKKSTKKWFKIIALILLLSFVGIQFIPVKLNEGEAAGPNDISSVFHIPGDVAVILDESCRDCHSNNTRYPWYSRVKPAAWLLEKHVKEGKEELNLSEFASYSTRRQRSKLSSTASQVRDGEMPLRTYLWLHPEAKLTQAEKERLLTWVNQVLSDNY